MLSGLRPALAEQTARRPGSAWIHVGHRDMDAREALRSLRNPPAFRGVLLRSLWGASKWLHASSAVRAQATLRPPGESLRRRAQPADDVRSRGMGDSRRDPSGRKGILQHEPLLRLTATRTLHTLLSFDHHSRMQSDGQLFRRFGEPRRSESLRAYFSQFGACRVSLKARRGSGGTGLRGLGRPQFRQGSSGGSRRCYSSGIQPRVASAGEMAEV